MDPYEAIKMLYRKHLENGWRMHEIDSMDIHFYLDLYEETETVSKNTYDFLLH